MLEIRLIWPALVLLVGALAIPLSRPWLEWPGRRFVVLVAATLAFALALWNRMSPPPAWTFSTWTGVGMNQGLQLTATPETSSLALLVTFAALALSLGTLDEPRATPDMGTGAHLLAVAAALLAVLLAGNFLTLLYAFVLLDAALILAARGRTGGGWPLLALVIGAASNILLLGGTLLVWQATGSVAFGGAAGQIVALRLLAGAFVLRLALFPFHLWAAPLPGLAPRGVVLVPLATLLAGGVWLCRGALLWGSEIAPPGLALPAAFALALLGFLAWRHKDSATKVATLAAWHGGWVVWAVAYGRPDLGLLLIACGILGLAALALHGGTVAPGESGWLPALLSAAAVVGLPGSALFTAGSWLFGQALYRRAPIVALLAALGVSAVSVALVELLSRSESRDRQPSRTIGLMLLGLAAWPLVAGRLGLLPELPPASAGRFDADLPLAVRVGPLLLGWAAAILLWQVRAGLRPAQGALDAAAALFSLTWLGQLGGRLLEVAASGLRGAMRVVEGENYGWLVFFLVLTLFFLTRG